MKTLIVHPQDPTTDFLKPIYANIENKTLITSGVSKNELRQLIIEHDRIICCGHGSPEGLLSVGQFLGVNSDIIDDTMVDILSQKKDNIFVWCNADQFVERNGLEGFYSGMFISEIQEAWYFNFYDLDRNAITESNEMFAHIVSKYINHPLDVLHKNVIKEYGLLANSNPIAKFNHERLYLTERNMYSSKLDKSNMDLSQSNNTYSLNFSG